MSSPLNRRGPRQRLSAEDRALWEHVAATTIPLAPDRAPCKIHPPAAPKRDTSHRPAPAPPPVSMPQRLRAPPDSRPRPVLPREPGVDRRTAERIRSGSRTPEARLDLHGMTADRAHPACLRFLGDALSRGLRLVLIITGKGAPEDSNPLAPRRGVLRSQVPVWIGASPHSSRIVGIYEAHRRHGGSGAYYVFLRRAR